MASVIRPELNRQLPSIHYVYTPRPQAIQNREKKIKMHTINFNTKALRKSCYNRGSSVLAYKEGIFNSAWGKNQACLPEREREREREREAGEQNLEG